MRAFSLPEFFAYMEFLRFPRFSSRKIPEYFEIEIRPFSIYDYAVATGRIAVIRINWQLY